jgi:hypothetical protein
VSGVSACRLNSFGVIETMVEVMVERGVPEHFRSDNGAEMTARDLSPNFHPAISRVPG